MHPYCKIGRDNRTFFVRQLENTGATNMNHTPKPRFLRRLYSNTPYGLVVLK